jgi:hypothetical protein
MAIKFLKDPGFPRAKCAFNGQALTKMQVREWAFADVDIDLGRVPPKDVDPPNVTSSNPAVVPPGGADDGVAAVWTVGTAQMDINFYAKGAGFSSILAFKDDPTTAVDGVRLQVEVLGRKANKQAEISMTKLLGKTVALNAPDAVSYQMDTTKTLPSSESKPESIADLLPAGGVNHLVIGSHAGFLGQIGANTELCMFAWGASSSIRLGIHNVDAVFSAIKGKMAEKAVIWLGGCNIGENNEFCQKAATDSKCTVVAATNALAAMKVPKGSIDMVDRYAGPKVFVPGASAPISMNAFCAKQDHHKFVVPV